MKGQTSRISCLPFTVYYLLFLSLFTFASLSAGFLLPSFAYAQLPCRFPWLGSFDTPDEAEGVFVSNSTAYVADTNSGLQIIDVSSCVVCQCPEDGRGGCISGTVTTYLTGEPVAGKTVWLKTFLRKSRKKLVKRVVTDENGCYGFYNLPQGRYTVYTKGGCKAVGGKGRRHFVKMRRNGEINDMDFDCR